jgi:transposase
MEEGIMAVSLPDARQLSDDVLEALRLRALRGCELGFTEAEIADLLGVSRETVSRWWCAYAQGGLAALPQQRRGRPLGTGRTLNDEQAAHLQQLLDEHSPEELGIASPLWNRRAVRDLIHKEYGIWMPVRTVGEYLKRWGYTAKKPNRHSRDQDPEEVQLWLEETYPLIEAQAEQEDAEIHWCDETGCAADQHPGCGYARRGEAATLEVPDRHIRMNLISTITNEGAVRFMTYKETMTAALFITFLSRLLRSTSKKVLLIVDRLPAHVAAKVEAWVDARPEQIDLYFLPRYAPELNADEYLNNDLKGSVNAAGLPHDKSELRSRIQEFMRRLLHLPERVMSYFQHPSVQYAAATEL